ncbi:MAG: purine-nucleoside phosphorylase [Deinococcota bacterium]
MSTHINANDGDIAETVLLPGDPLRAKYMAETFLDNPVCYNEVRGMYGFTGTYQGKRVSIQGTGMGMPSASIYINELMIFYGVKTLIRVGSCGSFQADLKLRDIVIAMSASTNSAMNSVIFNGMDYAATANFDLLLKAHQAAKDKGITARVGSVLSSDTFYAHDPDHWKLWAEYGVLAIEMEAAGLYALAAKHGARALAICTVSDSLVSDEAAPHEDRETTYTDMIEIALEAGLS